MRKIVVISMITLDGVMQAPGGPDEDTSGGFKYGGWTAPYADSSMDDEMKVPFDMLLGRHTYEIFASYWPDQEGEIADVFNNATKYVVADMPTELSWKGSKLITDDVETKIRALKEEDGPMLQVWGSAKMIQTLLKNDLVDVLHLKIFPITLGTGKKLFADGTIPAAFKLTKLSSTPSGVISADYERAGDVKTGTVGE
jgi:dihydrofolate reductase